MELTPENKKHIDSLNYWQLLERWRNSPCGDSWLMGDTGRYWGQRLVELRAHDPEAAVQASKDIGWDGPAKLPPLPPLTI